MFIGIVFVFVMFLFLFIFKKVKCLQTLYIKLKTRIMWSPILRSQIQFYLPVAINTFTFFKNESNKVFHIPVKVVELFLIITLPCYSFKILKTNLNKLSSLETKKRYGPIY